MEKKCAAYTYHLRPTRVSQLYHLSRLFKSSASGDFSHLASTILSSPLCAYLERRRRRNKAKMQAGRNAAEAMKEKAGNAAASARAGMEKTKATAQEKKERMTAHNPMEKEMATEKKDDRMTQAEMDKQMAQQHHAGARQAATTGQGGGPLHSTGGATGIHHPSYGTGTTTGGTATRDVNYGGTTTDGSGI